MKGGKEDIQVTGRIYMMGNEPFTQVAIQLDDGKVYALIREYDEDLPALQGKRVTVSRKLSGKSSRGGEGIELMSFQRLETKGEIRDQNVSPISFTGMRP